MDGTNHAPHYHPELMRNSCAVIITMLCLSLPAADGDLDTTFGVNGMVTTTIGAYSYANDIAVQRDGKIVVVGAQTAIDGQPGSIFVIRYDTDGSLDATFGSGGVVLARTLARGAGAFSVAIQGDGKIVVAGAGKLPTNESAIGVVRLLPSGSLDQGFGKGGMVSTAVGTNSVAYDVAILADGGILVAGGTSSAVLLARYTRRGALDPAFGSLGVVTTGVMPFPGVASAQALAIDATGRPVIAGRASTSLGAKNAWLLARYQADGSLDGSFSSDGIAVMPVSADGNQALGVATQGDGRIVAVGVSTEVSGLDMTITRSNTDGTLDGGFGTSGVALAGPGSLTDVAIQSDGKIVAAGGFDDHFTVVRTLANGGLDPSFGSGGTVATTSTFPVGASAMAIQADGKLLVIGNSFDGVRWRIVIARYLNTIAPVIEGPASVLAQVGSPFVFATRARNAPTSFSAIDLPAGLAIDPVSGAITGTPTTPGSGTATITATNGAGSDAASLLIQVAAAGSISVPVITSADSASGTPGEDFTFPVTASNAPTSFSAIGLPIDLVLDPDTGVISGTPSIKAIYEVTLFASNAAGTGSAVLVLDIDRHQSSGGDASDSLGGGSDCGSGSGIGLLALGLLLPLARIRRRI